ncbi:MAG: hypothetical protein ACTSYA_03785 [Candidatus Kariarchaeaceae archaeon]
MKQSDKLVIVRNCIYTYLLAEPAPEIKQTEEEWDAENLEILDKIQNNKTLIKVYELMFDLEDEYRRSFINMCRDWWDIDFYRTPAVLPYGYPESMYFQHSFLEETHIESLGTDEKTYGAIAFHDRLGLVLALGDSYCANTFKAYTSNHKLLRVSQEYIGEAYKTFYKAFYRNCEISETFQETPMTSMLKNLPFSGVNPLLAKYSLKTIDTRLTKALETFDNSELFSLFDLTLSDYQVIFSDMKLNKKCQGALKKWCDSHIALLEKQNH